MEGTICGVNASVYDPLYDCLADLGGPPLRGSRASLASISQSSVLSINKSKKFRPCLVLDDNFHTNYKRICLMATFGDTNFDELADLIQYVVRPVQRDHASFPDTPAIPVTPAWTRNPQWIICWPKNVTAELFPWQDPPHSVEVDVLDELSDYVRDLRIRLKDAARKNSGLRQRLLDNLLRWKRDHEAEANHSIYSRAPTRSHSSLISTRSYSSSTYSTSTNSLSSIAENSEADEMVASPPVTPTAATFSGKLMKTIRGKASSSSQFRRNVSLTKKLNKDTKDLPKKRINGSVVSVSSRRSQNSGKSCRWTQGPSTLCAV